MELKKADSVSRSFWHRDNGVIQHPLSLAGRKDDDDDDDSPRRSPNKSENRKFKEAVRQIGKRCGTPLTKDQIRWLHDEITGQNYTIPEIIEIGVGMFCPGS